MAVNGAAIFANPGTITLDGTDIGARVNMLRVIPMQTYVPIVPENYGGAPSDWLVLPGPVFITAIFQEWNAQVRKAVAGHMISSSGTGWVFGTKNGASTPAEIAGRKLSSLASYALAWTAAGGTGFLTFTAAKAVPMMGFLEPLEVTYGASQETRYAVTFGCLPPDAGGNSITLLESA